MNLKRKIIVGASILAILFLAFRVGSYYAAVKQTLFPSGNTLDRFEEVKVGMSWQTVEQRLGLPFSYSVYLNSSKWPIHTAQSSMNDWEGKVRGDFVASYSWPKRKDRTATTLNLSIYYRDGKVSRKEKTYQIWTMNLFRTLLET